MLKFNYPYSDLILDNRRKYESDCEITPAIYTMAHLECDRGNPMIECLPDSPTKAEIRNLYFAPFGEKCDISASIEDQISDVERMRDIRMPLPFYHSMETQFYNALKYSARRRFRDFRNRPFSIVMNDEEVIQNVSSKSAMGGDTGVGLTLLGIGGCGKSEAIANMVSRYPQIIRHSIEGIGVFFQVVWLNVVTPSNANLSNLYIAICEALDEALGNIVPVYAKYVKNLPTVGAKAKYVAQLIRNFNICSIILDEVQNLDSGKNRESSYNSLMEIINTTKIALVIVGTEDAYTMLCRKYYLARRTGDIIDASGYCHDRTQFDGRMKFLMQYNWFKPDAVMAPLPEILDVLYHETQGVIDRMISLWMNIQITYISAKSSAKPAITAAFIHSVSNNANPLMAAYTQQTLNNSPLCIETACVQDMEVVEPKELMGARQQVAENLLMDTLKTAENPKKAERVFQLVKNALIVMGIPYNDCNILPKVVSIMKYKKNENCTEEELAQKVVVALKRKASDARPKMPGVVPMDPDDFINAII